MQQIIAGTAELGRAAEPGTTQFEQLVSNIAELLSDGVTLDTSNNYTDGLSERIIGEAIRRFGGAHTSQVITKLDRDPDTGCFDRDRVLRSYEESVGRLGIEHFTLLHLHDPLTISFEEAMSAGGAVEGILELRNAGVTDSIGIASGPVPLLSQYVETGLFDAVLCHNRYNIIDQTALSLFAKAKSLGMQVINAAPFGAGALSRSVAKSAQFAYLPLTDELRQWLLRFEMLCAAHDVPMPAAALQFSIRQDLIDRTVVRASNAQRMDGLIRLASQPIAASFWNDLSELEPAPSTIDDRDPRRIRLYLEQIKPEDYWTESVLGASPSTEAPKTERPI